MLCPADHAAAARVAKPNSLSALPTRAARSPTSPPAAAHSAAAHLASTISGARRVSGRSRQTWRRWRLLLGEVGDRLRLPRSRSAGARDPARRGQSRSANHRAGQSRLHRRQRELEVKARAFLPQTGKLGHQRRVTPAAPVSGECAATRNEEAPTRAAAPGGCRSPARRCGARRHPNPPHRGKRRSRPAGTGDGCG